VEKKEQKKEVGSGVDQAKRIHPTADRTKNAIHSHLHRWNESEDESGKRACLWRIFETGELKGTDPAHGKP